MKTFIKLIKKFLGYFLLWIIIICVLMYWRASKYLDNKLNILDIIVNIIKDISANAIPSAIVVIISIYFFKTLRKMLQELKKIPVSEHVKIIGFNFLKIMPGVSTGIDIYENYITEIRLKRIESFMTEIFNQLKESNKFLPHVDEMHKKYLTVILEQLFESVSKEPSEEKRTWFKNYFHSAFNEPITVDNYDKKRDFLEAISAMSHLECYILKSLFDNQSDILVSKITYNRGIIDQYQIVGAVYKLKSRGFLMSSSASISIGTGVDNSLNETIRISNFGKEFVKFCLMNLSIQPTKNQTTHLYKVNTQFKS